MKRVFKVVIFVLPFLFFMFFPFKNVYATLEPVMVSDINVGTSSSMPQQFTIVGDTMYFVATNVTNGQEIWKSDGTEAGTVMVKDIYTGSSSSYPSSLISIGTTLYFSATDGINGQELWKSDGTEAGTVMVKDIYTGSSSSYPSYLTSVGETLYFSANSGTTYGTELWKSDGTEAGTVLIKDINSGNGSSSPYTGSYEIKQFVSLNGVIFFSANDGIHGTDLWKSDGTEIGTVMVKDFTPSNSWYSPKMFVLAGSYIYFQVDDGIHGPELWKTNGTEIETVLVKDIIPGIEGSNAWPQVDFYGCLFFWADDGVHGEEPWISNGESSGTLMIKDVNPGNETSVGYYLGTILGDYLYFDAYADVIGLELWKTDGTESGTELLKDFDLRDYYGGEPGELITVGNYIYFEAHDEQLGWILWRSDGSTIGTVQVQGGNINPFDPIFVGDAIFFSATNGTYGRELWKLDVDILPPEGSILINNNSQYTLSLSVSLSLNATDTLSSVTSMIVCDNELFTDCNWEIYQTTKSWTFTDTPGTKSVYVKYKDSEGNESEVYSDSIIYDTQAPTGSISINSGNTSTTTSNISLTLNSTDTLSGVNQMMICNDSSFTGCDWESYTETKAWTLSEGLGTKTIYVKYIDNAGNISEVFNDTIIVHTPDVLITDIGLVRNIADKSPLTIYFTSQTPVVKGISQPSSTVYFVYGGNTYSSVADSNGNFTITLNVSRGNNTIQYYSKDISNNQSETKTLTLIVGTESFPLYLLERLGLLTTKSEEPVVEDSPIKEEQTAAPIIDKENNNQEMPLVTSNIQTIQFLDKDNNPLVNALVIIEGQEYYTDSKGEIKVLGLEQGKNYKVKVEYNGIKYETEVLGEKQTDGSVIVNITEGDIAKGIDFKRIGTYGGISLLFILFLILILKKRKKKEEETYT